jgi:hypothetical protein
MTSDIEWNRKWNIIDARHDGNNMKRTGASSGSCLNIPLFNNSLVKLFGENTAKKHKNKYPGVKTTHYVNVLTSSNNQTSSQTNYPIFTKYDNVHIGIHDTENPNAKYGLDTHHTISYFFDSGTRSFDAKCVTQCLKNMKMDKNNPISIDLKPYGFNNMTFNASYKKNEFTINIINGVNDYELQIDDNGYVTGCNSGLPLNENYISGNFEKNKWISEKGASKKSQDTKIAEGFILCKLLGDLSHLFGNTDAIICTNDSFLLLRCLKNNRRCIISKPNPTGREHRYYFKPNIVAGPYGAMGGSIMTGGTKLSEDELTEIFTTHKYSETYKINEIKIRNKIVPIKVKVTWTDEEEETDKINSEERRNNTRLPIEASQEEEADERPNNTQLPIEASQEENVVNYNYIILLGILALIIALYYITKGGGKSLSKNNNNIQLTPDYIDLYIEHTLTHYNELLQNLKDIKNDKEDIYVDNKIIEFNKDIDDYIKKTINGISKLLHNDLLKNILIKHCAGVDTINILYDKIILYFPSNIIYKIDGQWTVINIKILPYLPLEMINEIEFNEINDDTLYNICKSNSHSVKNTSIISINNSIEFKIKDKYKFTFLLNFLKEKYIKDGPSIYLTQIEDFITHNIHKNDFRVFMKLLINAAENDFISDNDIVIELFKEIDDTDVNIGYTYYIICYPCLFLLGTYIFRYDLILTFVQEITQPNINNNNIYTIFNKIVNEHNNIELQDLINDNIKNNNKQLSKLKTIEEIQKYYKLHNDKIDLSYIKQIIKSLPFDYINNEIVDDIFNKIENNKSYTLHTNRLSKLSKPKNRHQINEISKITNKRRKPSNKRHKPSNKILPNKNISGVKQTIKKQNNNTRKNYNTIIPI